MKAAGPSQSWAQRLRVEYITLKSLTPVLSTALSAGLSSAMQPSRTSTRSPANLQTTIQASHIYNKEKKYSSEQAALVWLFHWQFLPQLVKELLWLEFPLPVQLHQIVMTIAGEGPKCAHTSMCCETQLMCRRPERKVLLKVCMFISVLLYLLTESGWSYVTALFYRWIMFGFSCRSRVKLLLVKTTFPDFLVL